jgi:hypothetical protein
MHVDSGLRHRLKKFPLVVCLWRLLKKAPLVCRYGVFRLIGNVTYPILGGRAALRGYYRKTRDFTKSGNGRYIELVPPSGARAPTPSDEPGAEIFVASIPGGRSLYDCGVAVSPDHRLLADVSWQDMVRGESLPLYHAAMYKIRLPPIRHVVGSVAVVTSVRPNNYFHWMFDILPRFEILRSSHLVPDLYLVNADTPFQKESLRALNIPLDRILSPTMHTHIAADELIVPSLPGPVFGLTPQARSCAFLRSAFLPKDRAPAPHRRLYITRADARERRVVNEAEIQRELLGYGFEIVSLTEMPFLQQVKLFSEAAIVVGPHGAGFANAVFCPPGSVLVEFMPPGHQTENFKRVSRFGGLEYRSIAAATDNAPGVPNFTNDHTVDVAELRKLLHPFGPRTGNP